MEKMRLRGRGKGMGKKYFREWGGRKRRGGSGGLDTRNLSSLVGRAK